MAKATAALATEIVAPEATVPAIPAEMTPNVTLLPPMIHLVGPTMQVLAQLVVHARLGYHLDTAAPLDQFSNAGNISMFLRLGTPEDGIVKLAADSIDLAAAQHRAAYARDVEQTARRMIEDDKRAALEAEVAAKIAETQRQIAALQASLAQ